MPTKEAAARIKINRLLEAAGWHFFPDNGATANIRVWDLERGNPYIITAFPSPDSVTGYQRVTPNPHRLVDEQVGQDYIVLTQRPTYQSEAAWKNEAERRMLLPTAPSGVQAASPLFGTLC